MKTIHRSLVIEPNAGLKRLLQSSLDPSNTWISSECHTEALLKKIMQIQPDLILVDASAADTNTFELTETIQQLNKLSANVMVLAGQIFQKPEDLIKTVTGIIRNFPQKQLSDSTISSLYSQLGLSQDSFAQILRVSPRTLARWLAGTAKPSPSHRDRIEKVKLFYRKISKLLRPDGIRKYLFAYNENLDRKRPFDLLVAQDFDSVLADLAALEEGVYA
ncbi:MAG: helix-turn-helix domain-containing protein [Nitrospirae bacterium]|nr:helix-turn-helix domain-containing protein [Nitrospirota bacterium]